MRYGRTLCSISAAILLATSLPLLGLHTALGETASPAPAPGTPPTVAQVGARTCSWPEVSGERLLNRPLGQVSFTATTVWEVVHTLIRQHHVPLSFIETDPDLRLTLDLRDGTVRQVLDAIVARVPRYRYGFVSSRLVLYPHDSIWDSKQLDDLRLEQGPRRQVGIELVEDLLRRVPAFAAADLRDPWLFGNPDSFVYQDRVKVTGPASALELFVQLLGSRASAVFTVNKIKGTVGTPLWLNTANLVQSVELTAPTTNLVRRDQAVQLKLMGTLYDGTRKNLTVGGCGTEYSVSNPQVLAVGPDGLVSVRGEGEASVTASNEHLATVTFKVSLGERHRPTPPPGR